MEKFVTFLKVFGLCFILSIVGWLIIGGLLSLFIPSFTITVILSAGVGTGIGCGLVNGLLMAFF